MSVKRVVRSPAIPMGDICDICDICHICHIRDIQTICYVGACCAMQNSTELEQIGNIYSKRIFLAHIITNSSANG